MVNHKDLVKCQSCTNLNTLDEMGKELSIIKKLCAKHELIYNSFFLWENAVLKNECQLEILDETAKVLNARRENLARKLILRRSSNYHPDNRSNLIRLDAEIRAVEKQVDGWMKDLAEVSQDRTKLNIELIQLRCKLRHSLTNINLAHIDFEFVEQQHRELWRRFLYDMPNSEIESICEKQRQQALCVKQS